MKQKHPKKEKEFYIPHKHEIRTAISNICPFCGDRGDSHRKNKIRTKEGELKVRICTACSKTYKRLDEN